MKREDIEKDSSWVQKNQYFLEFILYFYDILYVLWKDCRLLVDNVLNGNGRMFMMIEATEKRYGNAIKIYFPDASAVEEMVNEKGVNLFYNGVEERKRCCRIRKIEPLRCALAPYSSWICGLRQKQSITRENLRVISWDDGNRMSKINPLFNWTEKDVRDYIRKYDVPYNKLHDDGYPSIGCACCTRAVKPEDDIRSGRWWWKSPEQKECGLHVVNGKLVRKK